MVVQCFLQKNYIVIINCVFYKNVVVVDVVFFFYYFQFYKFLGFKVGVFFFDWLFKKCFVVFDDVWFNGICYVMLSGWILVLVYQGEGNLMIEWLFKQGVIFFFVNIDED